jgi:hypothetical protein
LVLTGILSKQVFYLLLIVGGFGAFLVAGLPLLPNAFLSELHMYDVPRGFLGLHWLTQPWCSGLSCGVVLLAMHSFIVASTTSPGIVTPRRRDFHFPVPIEMLTAHM